MDDEVATRIVSTKPTARLARASTIWIGRRMGRGANASTRTPAMAAPNTTSIGESWPHSMLGALIVGPAAARIPVTGSSSG